MIFFFFSISPFETSQNIPSQLQTANDLHRRHKLLFTKTISYASSLINPLASPQTKTYPPFTSRLMRSLIPSTNEAI